MSRQHATPPDTLPSCADRSGGRCELCLLHAAAVSTAEPPSNVAEPRSGPAVLCLACKSHAGLPVQPTACTSLDQPGSASRPPETLQRRLSLGLVQEDQSRKRLPLPRCSCDRR